MKKETKHSNTIFQKVGKNHGFTTPENYLENLEDTVFSKFKVDALPKSTGYKIPTNYMNNIEEDILSKVVINEKQIKVITLKQRMLKLIPYAAVASMVLFIALNSFVFQSDANLNLDSLDDADIEYWLNNNDINYTDVAAVLETEIANENDLSLTTLNTNNIEDYLISTDEYSIFDEIN